MLLTEEEAKTKTCCQFRATQIERDSVTLHRFMCSGSTCMAWRWGEFIGPNDYKAGIRCDMAPTPARGFCGLAGKAVA